jgi:tRNA U34 5-carboxymethylaminomethyl modifying GTPase MnmE/TrmE
MSVATKASFQQQQNERGPAAPSGTITYAEAERVTKTLADELDQIASVVGEKVAVGETGEKLAQDIASKLSNRARQLREDTFRILVVGEFKRGKSTFLNALLGQKVLPAKAAPCTAIVTVIRYGDQPGARVVFDDGRPDEVLSFDDFKQRYELTVDDATEQTIVTDRFAKIDHAVMSYPLELCHHRVELIDSPGLGEHATRTKRTVGYLAHADAIIMVLDATMLLSEDELHFLTSVLLPRGLRNIFFVVNKWNMVTYPDKDPDEVERDVRDLDARLRQHLTQFVTVSGRDLHHERIFRINALGALNGRLRHQPPADVAATNVPVLEQSLQKFLIENRARVRNENVLSNARTVRDDISRFIATQLALAGKSLAQIEAEQRLIQPKLEQLRSIREHIMKYLRDQAEILQSRLITSLTAHMNKMKEDLPQDVTDEKHFNLEVIGRGSILYKLILDKFKKNEEEKFSKQVELSLAPQVTRYLEKKLDTWRMAVVQNEMKTVMIDVKKELQAEARHYEAVMVEIQQQLGLSGDTATAKQLVEQWLSRGGEGPGTDAGIKQMDLTVPLLGDFSFLLASLASEIALHLTTAAVPLIGAAFTAFRLVWREMRVRKEIRKKLAEKLEENMDHIVAKNSAMIRQQVGTSFDGLRQRIGGNIDEQIAVVNASLQEIIDRKQDQEFSAEQEKQRLDEARQSLDTSIERIEALIGAGR